MLIEDFIYILFKSYSIRNTLFLLSDLTEYSSPFFHQNSVVLLIVFSWVYTVDIIITSINYPNKNDLKIFFTVYLYPFNDERKTACREKHSGFQINRFSIAGFNLIQPLLSVYFFFFSPSLQLLTQ